MYQAVYWWRRRLPWRAGAGWCSQTSKESVLDGSKMGTVTFPVGRGEHLLVVNLHVAEVSTAGISCIA